jgi:hypothetical protein
VREGFRLVQENAYQYEDDLVWLLPLNQIPSVKEKIITTSSRTKKPRGKYVGYATLFPETPNNGRPSKFYRRVFILDPEGLAPDKVIPGVRLDKCR